MNNTRSIFRLRVLWTFYKKKFLTSIDDQADMNISS